MTAPAPSIVDTWAADDLAELRTSARGWHGVQLAVLGFIGLCGALNSIGTKDNPAWLEQLAGLLVVASVGLACVATVLVASAAWPVHGSVHDPVSGEQEALRTGRRLRAGIVLTFLAVLALAVATGSSWWPSPDDGHLVELSTADGSVCGALMESSTGTLSVQAGGRQFVIPVTDVVSVRPIEDCSAV